MSTEESDTATQPRPETLLELHIPQTTEGSVAATAPVRWCVSSELIEDLRRREFVKPKLVLVIRAPINERVAGENVIVMRQTAVRVVPLEAELTYLSFERAGANDIRAFIVDGDGEEAVHGLIELQRAGRTDEVLHEDGQVSWNFLTHFNRYITLNSQLNVNVPTEMFAKDYPEWQQKLVRRFFSGKERDQCHFRGRRIISFILAFILLTLGQLVKVLLTFLALYFGGRKLAYKQFLHPWKSKIDGVIAPCERKGSIWFHDQHSNARPSPLWLINPIVLTVPPAIVYGAMQLAANSTNSLPKHQTFLEHKLSYPGWFGTWWMADLAIVCLAVGLTALVLIVWLVIIGGDAVVSTYTGSQTHRQRRLEDEKRQAQERAASKARIFSSLESMTCGITSPEASLEALPVDKRTVQLRYLDLKAKVCKPFAR